MSDDSTTRIARRSTPSPTLRDVIGVMFRQRRTAIISFLSIFTLTAAYALLSHSYQAHMKVLLRHGRVDAVISPEAHSPVVFAHPEISEEEVNSEVELLRDQALLRQVVKQNGLASGRTWTDFFGKADQRERRMARAVRSLAAGLKVEPIRKTNLILVSYDSADPALSARVLNSLAKLYLEKHKEVRRSSEEYPFFELQARQSLDRLNDLESQLVNFSRQRGVVSGALERDLALQRMGELAGSYQQVRVAIQETTRRVQELEAKLKSFPERSVSAIRTSDNPELQGTLQAKLLELELKRTELLTKFEPGYRLVQEVEEEIAKTNAAIRAERLSPVREETTEKDPNYEWTKAELTKAEVELTALQARERAIVDESGAAQAEAKRLGEAAIEQQDLVRNQKTAEESYLLYSKKSEEARIDDALDERGIVNATLVEAPVTPVLPKRSFWLVILTGLVTASAASTLLAFSMDYFDPGFRTPDEVAALLQAPVLASLPREAA